MTVTTTKWNIVGVNYVDLLADHDQSSHWSSSDSIVIIVGISMFNRHYWSYKYKIKI